MREAISSAIAAMVRWSGVAALVRFTVARRRVSVLVYHDPTPAEFERHLRYLAKHYNFIRLGDLVDAIHQNRWSDLPPRSLVLTFDDGRRGTAKLAELFSRYGVRPTIYVCSQLIGTKRHYWFLESQDPETLKGLSNEERLAVLEKRGFFPTKEYVDAQALDSSELARLKDIVDFAAHTRFHPVLTTCSDRECATEIESSKGELEAVLGQPCLDFSYPNGDYGEREVALVRRAGYRSARTVHLGWNTAATDPYQLKALGTNDHASVNRLASDLAGVSGYFARLRVGSLTGKHRPVLNRSARAQVAPSRTP